MYRIYDDARNGAGIEHHTSPRNAFRAALILSAHEIKNGRVPNYRVEPPHFVTFDEVKEGLPAWAREALATAGLE